MTDILTRIKVKEERIIPTGFGKAIEYKFTTNFTPSPGIVGSSKQVVVNVRQRGDQTALLAEVEILLIKPNNVQESGAIAAPVHIQAKSSPTLGNIKFAGKPGINVFDDIEVISPADPPLPPPDHLTRFKYLIKENDPNGIWTIQIRNKGLQSEKFEIEIGHPDLQLELVESKVPFSLLNRLIDKVNRLFAVKLKIDNDLTLDFSNKVKKMLAIDKILVEIGEISTDIPLPKEPLTGISPGSFPIDFSLNNINLQTLNLKIIPSGNDAIALATDLVFETSGNEINVAGPNINIIKLEVNTELAFKAASNPTFFEERNLAGEFVASHPPICDTNLTFNPTILAERFLVFNTQDGINKGAKAAFTKLLRDQSSKRVLKTVADHFTDMLLFLASGRADQVFFDILPSASDFTVRHYVQPSAKTRLKHDLNFVTPADKAITTAKAKATEVAGIPGITMTAAVTNKKMSFLTHFKQKAFTLFQIKGRKRAVNLPKVNAPTNPNFKKIEHIVILTLENRSFDHMLGYLTKKKNRTDIDGLDAPVNHTNHVPGTNFNESVFKLTNGAIVSVDPGHNVDEVKEQIANGQMSGFVSSYISKSAIKNNPGSEKLVMGFYDDDTLGVYDTLAENYMVCDRWFSSHPGATYPNRFISLMGSAPSIRNFEIGGNEAGAVKGETIFDILTKNHVSWKYVESNIAFLRMFNKYRVDEENIIQRKEWLDMARNGKLPAVSWVDPHIVDLEIEGEADDDHPPANVSKGQMGVKEIYEALRSNDLHWQKTLFIITYDEHGGFYDHVPPHGINGETNPVVHKINDEGEDHYGVRVPAFVISPWVRKKSVSSTIFDHTSLLKTILLNFVGPEATNKELLGKRTDSANSILSVLEDRPRGSTPRTIAHNPGTAAIKPRLEINEREMNTDSFHDNMLLFGFGSKFRKIVAAEIEKREE